MMKKSPLLSLLQDRDVLPDVLRNVLTLEDSRTLDMGRLDGLLKGTEAPVVGDQYTVTEAIVLKVGRPALFVKGGKWEQPKSAELAKRLDGARGDLERAIPAVGRIEIVGDSGRFIGTGWMIEDDVLITNRHVAQLFAGSRGGVLSFLAAPDGGKLGVQVDFLREAGNTAVRLARISDVVFVESPIDGQPDMALLRVAPGTEGLPARMQLDDRPIAFQDNVAAIGYPAEDSRNDFYVMRSIFGTSYGVKRLSPGRISGVRPDGMAIDHDCSTLGGSSGSALINLATGKVCGLHYRGTYLDRNTAVSAAAIRQRLAQLGRPLVSVPAKVQPSDGAPLKSDGTTAGTLPDAERAAARSRGPTAQDLSTRTGYDPEFLGADLPVPLPVVPASLAGQIAPVAGRDDGELTYRHFSIKLRKDRRVAFFTAVNIDGSLLYRFPREPDRWFPDPRVAADHQTGAGLYTGNNLDRGHLVRRLDPTWGDTRAEAAQAMADTFFYANCSPQHARLNQQTWAGLEDYVLDNAATHAFKATVITGPVFADGDRVYRGVGLPEEFWKVVVIQNAFTKRLSATAYLLSQTDLLSDLEFLYGEYRTYQVPVQQIADKTGLDFGELPQFDPMASIEGVPRREIRGADDLLL